MEDNQAYITSIVPEVLKFEGQVKQSPDHFKVMEVPLYQPNGTGQHIYLTITRQNQNTHDVIQTLASKLKISKRNIGVAGKKDKNATTTQTFSLDMGANSDESEVRSILTKYAPELSIDSVSKHNNKIKMGHLLGNTFEIVILTSCKDALEKITKIKKIFEEKGAPNYYGTQRFGSKGDNAIRGKQLLLSQEEIIKRDKNRFLLSAYQSSLFNSWLATRIQDNLFLQTVEGDLTNKEGIYTGPMFGKKMQHTTGEAYLREISLLENEQISLEQFDKLPGSRRPGKVFPGNIEASTHNEGITLRFFLPKGSYATAIIDQFVRKD